MTFRHAVTVYHVRDDAPLGVAFFEHPESWDERSEYYEKMGCVHVQAERLPMGALEMAFAKTQNIDRAWVKQPIVTEAEREARSTSVGDVLELDGAYYEVAAIGFDCINDLVDRGTPLSSLNED